MRKINLNEQCDICMSVIDSEDYLGSIKIELILINKNIQCEYNVKFSTWITISDWTSFAKRENNKIMDLDNVERISIFENNLLYLDLSHKGLYDNIELKSYFTLTEESLNSFLREFGDLL